MSRSRTRAWTLAATALAFAHHAGAQTAPTEAPAASPAPPSSPASTAPREPASAAPAGESAGGGSWPRVGGHVGITVPIVMIGGAATQVIGKDYFDLGPAFGVTIKLSEKFAFDFENVITEPLAKSNNIPASKQPVSYIIDPGVVYDFGVIAIGGRVGFNILAPENVGLIPIVNKGFPINDRIAFFVEADFPIFFQPGGTVFTPVFHFGLGF